MSYTYDHEHTAPDFWDSVNEEWVPYPSGFEARKPGPVYQKDWRSPSVSQHLAEDAEFAGVHRVYRVNNLVREPAHNEVVDFDLESTPVFNGDTGRHERYYFIRAKTSDEISADKAALLAHVEEVRWQVEQGGITIGEMAIPTRDRDKLLINGKVSAILSEDRPDSDTFNFVLNGQNINMTNGQMKAIGIAIEQHVQHTIDVAGDIRPQIEDGTLTTQEEVRAAYMNSFNS